MCICLLWCANPERLRIALLATSAGNQLRLNSSDSYKSFKGGSNGQGSAGLGSHRTITWYILSRSCGGSCDILHDDCMQIWRARVEFIGWTPPSPFLSPSPSFQRQTVRVAAVKVKFHRGDTSTMRNKPHGRPEDDAPIMHALLRALRAPMLELGHVRTARPIASWSHTERCKQRSAWFCDERAHTMISKSRIAANIAQGSHSQSCQIVATLIIGIDQ